MSNVEMVPMPLAEGHQFCTILVDGREAGSTPCMRCGHYPDEWSEGVFTTCPEDRPMKVCAVCSGSGIKPADELGYGKEPRQCPGCLGRRFIDA